MSMAHVRVFLVMLVVVAALGIPAIVLADTTISGKVAPADTAIKTLDKDAVLILQLFETQKGQSGAGSVVRQQLIPVGGSAVPVSFNFSAPTANATSTYRLLVSLGHSPSRKMDFQSGFPVLNGNQLPAVLTLAKMPGTLPPFSGGSRSLLLGLLLAGLTGVLAVWRWQRNRGWSLQRA